MKSKLKSDPVKAELAVSVFVGKNGCLKAVQMAETAETADLSYLL